MKRYRKSFFLNLIKLAARREDIEALRGILEFKYPGDRRVPGFAVQYYEKFIKGKNLSTPLTEDNLPQPLPDTIEELLILLQTTETVKKKTKKEEFAESLKSKYPNVDLTNLNEDYLSWLNQRYIENKIKSGEIVHPIEEALETLRKFPSVQDKYKASAEFRSKVEAAGYQDISSIQNLTLDEMENIISLDTSDLTVRVEGVRVKPEEFLGKFGEWNLWLPHTKDTSAKIAGYDENHNPKTTWCTARTKGSNLFYNYIGRKDIPTFLFYIIKDNPKNDEDWLSLGYISQGNRLVPDFSGTDGGLSVDRANRGLTEWDYSRVLGDSWNSIKSRVESEIERHKIVEGGEEKYISPARSIIQGLAKNLEEFKKELTPKSNEEKKDFIEVIMDSNPSDEVLDICGKTLARIDPVDFLYNHSNKPWAKPHLGLAARNCAEKDPVYILYHHSEKPWAEPHLGLAARNCAEKDPESFLREYSEKPWAEPHLGLAARNCAEKYPGYFLKNFSEAPWAKPYIDLAAKNLAEKNSKYFLENFSEKPWAEPYLDLAAKNLAEKNSKYFLENFSEKPWAEPYLDLAARNLIEKDPEYFLHRFSKEPWAKPYIDLAAKNLAEKNSKYFLDYYSEKPWAEPYLDLAARNLIEKDPEYSLRYFSEKPWAKLYIDLAAKIVAEKDARYFLRNFSEKPWAKPHLALAARNCAEKKPEYLLDRFSEEPWAEPYRDLAAKNYAEKDPKYFLSDFSEKPWAKPYIDSAAKIVAEKNPEYFLEKFSFYEWAQPYIGLAKSKLNNKEASTSIQDKLLKLSNFLKSNNLKEYINIREIM